VQKNNNKSVNESEVVACLLTPPDLSSLIVAMNKGEENFLLVVLFRPID
jgi:hypothetical protein